MILTFELDDRAESLEVFFDAEGRDQLIARLIDCNKPGDHIHLFSKDASVSGYAITANQFLKNSKTIEMVTIGMPLELADEVADSGSTP